MANGTTKPVFIGIAFPYTKGTEGIPKTETNIDLIKSDISLLLNTRKRERVMLPNFGLNLEQIIFENTGPLLRAKVFREIVDAISNYEPRVSVENVTIEENENTVTISLIYSVSGLIDQLILEFNRDGNGN